MDSVTIITCSPAKKQNQGCSYYPSETLIFAISLTYLYTYDHGSYYTFNDTYIRIYIYTRIYICIYVYHIVYIYISYSVYIYIYHIVYIYIYHTVYNIYIYHIVCIYISYSVYIYISYSVYIYHTVYNIYIYHIVCIYIYHIVCILYISYSVYILYCVYCLLDLTRFWSSGSHCCSSWPCHGQVSPALPASVVFDIGFPGVSIVMGYPKRMVYNGKSGQIITTSLFSLTGNHG